ncbi:RNase adapter RapZ [Phaeobacter sp. PT47_59]|uniref:RNase adapter RapZ n=1 Tax=Phaeobacter sp. PT47_59 TaxID=3029979 RepID=UPI0023802253|nr:RNase adapter RapZ [Phaeobacter sp. PT47_59]MDE4174119.1 RNase adapter RapZ [Phaeobacter sp. PT47_59]
MPKPSRDVQPIVLVTGPSGAGRTTAINVLEDLGFEAIDNLPLRLLPKLIDVQDSAAPMALGLDSRNRDFSPAGLLDMIDMLAARRSAELTVLYLDARAEILLRRYSETRRRHPLAPAETPEVGVAKELDLMAPIRERADMLLETSEMNVHQLKAEIEHWFAPGGRSLALSVQSFSYKRGVPRSVDLVFDCRFLANPYWKQELRHLNGRDAAVQAYVAEDPLYEGFLLRVTDMVQFLLPAFRREGKSHLSIAFGCTGGQHRSVTLAETLAKALAEDGQQVSIRHRELQS